MAFISAYASCSTTLTSSFDQDPPIPGQIFINTTDTLAAVMDVGYLNGQTLLPLGYPQFSPTFQIGQIANVNTSDSGTVQLRISIDGSSNINLVPLSAMPV